ncbi:hypothetical protein [Pseudoxanthomonas sacheonensis]|uniref:Secreted protein n=1 Tax=Pseudoxanthomonas sacheonensis TaxID=443615 RepID=A0ABU1RPK7_9GAMM|nr:hypothetical protein [Pseudoxanthomonas sacheonensis]MDR6840697.1 hypothetical protein [Pseudoxanthomonas sacheonensis]
MIRRFFTLALVCCAFPAFAQLLASKPKASSPPARVKAAPYNSASKDTTPLDCEKYRAHPHPGMIGFCQGMETSLLQNEARRQGRPTPSQSVIRLPTMGTPAAKELGYACIGGSAMRKLPNGWEQVATTAGWQRCIEG